MEFLGVIIAFIAALLILVLIFAETQQILERINEMAIDVTELKTEFAAYAADVTRLIAQNQADVAKIVADAVAADDAGDVVKLADVLKDVKDAHAKLVVPPFVPSNN